MAYPHTEKDTDRRIRAMMRGGMPPVSSDPWFVRKTLNRLPSRRSRIVSPFEIAAFVIVLTVSAFIVVRELRDAFSVPGGDGGFSAGVALCAALAALVATLYISAPILRRS